MTNLSRRSFALASTGLIVGSTTLFGQEKPKQDKPKGPIEAEFNRDYDPPKFKPGWKNKQINRTMARDFVIYAHDNLEMTEKLLKREPGLINATVDWGAGDYESALGGASHMGRKDIARLLLKNGARMDIFCAAMLGMLDAVKAFLTFEPALLDAKGPHGFFNLHRHAQYGLEEAKPVLDYLQSVKEKQLGPLPPFLKKKPADK